MNLWVWRPESNAFDDLQRQMSRLMDWTLNVVEQHFSPSWQPLPSCNVYETDKDYQFLMPMPGVLVENLDVQVSGSQLVIKGERKRPDDIADNQYRRQERWVGRWSRVIQLPDRANPEQIEATLEHGMLLVHVGKLPQAQPRQVAVAVKTSTPPAAVISTDRREP
ncbi:MAG TPA: Hsp20/alpha crystallin family protein [Gemmatales bacterium]|nr:Hsp20/alpha crystallin family protein [Gemmatales bacterium]HMP15633.1 Hsp20/alpha crystallin family protein [Gemmatales bacterium]